MKNMVTQGTQQPLQQLYPDLNFTILLVIFGAVVARRREGGGALLGLLGSGGRGACCVFVFEQPGHRNSILGSDDYRAAMGGDLAREGTRQVLISLLWSYCAMGNGGYIIKVSFYLRYTVHRFGGKVGLPIQGRTETQYSMCPLIRN